MQILGIDPGPRSSGVVAWEEGAVVWAQQAMPNEEVREEIKKGWDLVCLERIRAAYAHIGVSTVDTIWESARFYQLAIEWGISVWCASPDQVRQTVAGTTRARDSGVRQALLDLIGPQGVKRDPGPTYGVSKHAWRALAVIQAWRMGCEGGILTE